MINVQLKGLTWLEILNIARATQGKGKSLKEPSTEWIAKIVKSEHSPIRFRQYYITATMPYWVAMHLRTHWVGVTAHELAGICITSSRTDITGMDRDPNRMVTMYTLMNVQAVLNISKARLCSKASPETVAVWADILTTIGLLDPEVAAACGPSCSDCKEFKPCERSY